MAVRAGVQLRVSVSSSLFAKELDSSEGDMALVKEVHLRIPRGELDVPLLSYRIAHSRAPLSKLVDFLVFASLS